MAGPFKMKNHGLSASAKYKTPIQYASPAKADTILPEVKVTEKKTKHKDITNTDNKGKGFNAEIRKGIKSGTTKVYERADGSIYTSTTKRSTETR